MKRNKFSRALKHLKSTRIDEKLKSLEEASPTNNMSGVYQVTPDTGDGFRLGVGDPDKKFYPKADGTWPSGIPANASDTVYIRKGGYFDSGKGVIPTNQVPVSRDFSYNDVNTNGSTNTDSFIRPSDGKPYTSLPEGTESFILGPLVGNYAINHGYDDFTNLGYIQKDTRQFVLLGRIQGHFRGEDKPRTSFGGGHARTFDGTSSQFTSFNSNFKLEHALWMQERYTEGNFVSNFPFNFAGGIPVERHPDNNSMGSGDIIGTDDAKVGGNNDDIGTPQDPPDENDIESLEMWGIEYDKQNPKPKRSDFGPGRDGRAEYEKAKRDWEKSKNEARDREFTGGDTQGEFMPSNPNFRGAGNNKNYDPNEANSPVSNNLLNTLAQGARDFGNYISNKIESSIDSALEYLSKPMPERPSTGQGGRPLGDTTNRGGEVDSAGRYNLALATNLPISIISGQSMEIPVSDAGANSMQNSIQSPSQLDAFDKALTFDKSTPTDAENTINPVGKTDQVLGNGWQVQGGGTFNFNNETDELEIVFNKTLRDSSGGETRRPDGTFTDIPDLDIEKAKAITDKALQNPVVDKFLDGLANTVKVVQKIGGGESYEYMGKTYNNAWDLMKNNQDTTMYTDFRDTIANLSKDATENTVQGTASNAYAIRNFLQNLEVKSSIDSKGWKPFAQNSDIENVGGGKGHVYSSVTIPYNQLNPNLKAIVDKGRKVNESTAYSTKKRILREVRQPLKEIKELPKTTKLKGYKPNFKGKFSPQNTPDVTASKKSDDIVSAKNSSRQVWTAKDKYWKGYETTERMNIIYDNLGFGSQFFDTTTGKNAQLKEQQKKRVQEHLNMLAHQKAMREVYGVKEYKNKIAEQETYDNKVKDPLFSKVSDRLNKEIDYPNKPSPLGYPNEAPPKIDPNTGMHPKYGKRYKYDKLDPVSAVMMKRAPTGDPEIDANVKKAAQLKKEHKEIDDQIYEWMLGKLKSDWRKELEEGMTTSNAFSTVLPAEGDTAIDQVSPVDAASFASSDLFFGPGEFGNNSAQAQKSTQIRSSGSGSGSTGGFDVGGDYLAFQGSEGIGSERWAILKPIDATKVDSITITAIRGTGSNGGEHPDVVGTEELYIRYKTPDMNISQYLSFDRSGNAVGSFPADAAIIGINQGDGTLQNYTITIPEYARQKNVTFALYQKGNSGSQYDHYGVTDIKFQRRTPINVVVPLDSPEAISFIRVGTDEGDPKKRKKKVNDQLAASDEYVAQQMGGEFPGQGTRIDGEDPFKSAEVQDVTEPSPIGKDEVAKSFADFQQGQKTVEVLKTPEQIEAQNDEYFADLENLLVANEYDYGDPQILEITDKILKLDPKNVDAYYFKDYYYYINDDMESAKGVIDEMIKNIPDSPDGYSIRSYYKQEEGDLAGAIEDLEKALELEPDPDYIAYIELELADLKFQEAEAETDNAIKDRLESEAAAVQEKAHKDYWSNAEDLMPENNLTVEQEQQISSNLAQAKDLMTTTHYSGGRDGVFSKGAVDLLQEILPIDPNNTEILSNLGVAMIMDRYSSSREGIEYLEKAQALDPNVKIDFGINSWDRYDDQFSASDPAYSGSKIERLANLPHRYAREIIENLPDQSSAQGATYGATDSDYAKDYGGSYSEYYTNEAKRMTTSKLQSMLVDAAREIEDNKYWMSRAYDNTSGTNKISINAAVGFAQAGMSGAFTGQIPPDIRQKLQDARKELERKSNEAYRITIDPANYIPVKNAAYQAAYAFYYEGGWKNSEEYQYEQKNKFIPYARDAAFSYNASVKMDVEKYQAYYDEYMSREVGELELPELPAEEIPTLYDWMQTTYDDEKINQEIQEQGFDKQFKDLMTAWDSADKFSKFITPLKNLSDALLGSKTAQNAKYENYKIAIAKSIMLNKPIRVNPDTIDPALIKKLGDRITPNQILSYDEEKRFKDMQEKYAKLVKEGKGDPSLLYDYDQPLAEDGIPLIPIVSEPVPYADENIYEDEFGRVFTNDGSVANTTLQPDRAYHGFASAYKAEIFGTNPLAGRGQAQYQIVVPPDGSEPYLLYKDHAYHNVKSADEGEVPGFMNKGAAGFVNWLGNTAHARSDGDANTGGMAGYPPNIRGDVITEFRIPIADLSKEVQESVYRHKMMTENPDLVQVLRDYFYTEDKVKTFNIGGKDAKGLHNLYTNVILKRADQLKDFITDNRVELVLRGIGKITGAEEIGNITTASNMLQRYDDYIQQTIYTSDGKAYVPGVTTPDGNVISRININDQFTKGSQNKLQQIMSDKEVQALVKRYVIDGKTEGAKDTLEMMLNTHIGDKKILGFALSNSLGGGAQIDIDEFLNGRLVIKKNYEFRHDESIDKVGVEYDLSKGLLGLFGVEKKGTLPIAKTLASLFDVSNDAWAHHDNIAVATLASVATMGAARQLLRPVRNQGQSFAEAMNVAPTMPYKLEFDVSEKIMKILQGIEDKSREEKDLGVSTTDAATLAALNKKKKKKPMKEQTLYERIKSKPFFNPKDIKPTFPESDPPELDPKTKMHPNYGKQAKRYNKLDPMSANAMPPTGDPEIDAVVDKQRTKKKPSERRKDYVKTASKIKKLAKGI